MSQLKYWIWLSGALGFASAKVKYLLQKFGTAENIYNTDIKDIRAKCDISLFEVRGLANKSLENAETILKCCKNSGISVLAYDDIRYPERLRNIPDPPVCLYYKGELPDFDSIPTVCVVGTRDADDYSCKAAWSLSARLSLANVLVVSGGAIGIDTAAHKGCLDSGNKTVALLGCGINYPYLMKNAQLRKKISENGCIISEYPPDYPVCKPAFHQRNRIMSGLSLGTVVIQAGQKSGALITARSAAEQGRDVFVITGKPDDKKYSGSNMLLRDGAIPVFSADDIIFEYIGSFGNIIDIEKAHEFDLAGLYRSLSSSQEVVNKTKAYDKAKVKNDSSEKINFKNFNESLSKKAQIVYNCIDIDLFTVDDLVESGLSISDIFSALTELELIGAITAVPGGRYSKKQ